jgi:glutaredoxin
MAERRQVEVFSAGCPVCEEAIRLVRELACDSCEVTVRDMNDPQEAARAAGLGIKAVPAVVVDGTLAPCCAGSRPDEAALREAGLGRPLA